jgi:GNAT superfamily N-acetyltransferase
MQRRLDLLAVDGAPLDALMAGARSAGAGYDLVRIAEPVPEHLVDDVVALTATIDDAPQGDLAMDAEVLTPARLRAFERAQRAGGLRVHRLAARHRGSGALAGHTVVAVEAERRWHAHQYDTSVVAAHRGHRLGRLLKGSMMGWLTEEGSQLRTLDTWNAEDNAPMVAVNEALGYTLLARGTAWQRKL